MRQIVDQETKGNIRVTVFDDDTAKVEGLVSAKIMSINMDRPQTNSNQKVFYIATVKTDKGNTGSAIIWENQLTTDKLPKDTFAPGAPVRIAIQLKGDYAGNATVELPWVREEEIRHQNEQISPSIEIHNDEYFEESDSSFQSLEESLSYNQEEFSYFRNPATSNSATKTISNGKEGIGLVKLFLIFAFSFIAIGFILSPLSFLGFILYPFWVGGAILITGFLAKIFHI